VTASGVEDVPVNKAAGATATCWIPVLVDDVDGTPVNDGLLVHDAGGASIDGRLITFGVLVLVSVGRGVVDCDAGGASVDGISVITEVLVPVSDGGGAVDADTEASDVVPVRAGTCPCRGAY
jgi:hypothetical protein